MPNKPHAPRSGTSSSKRNKGPVGADDTSFIQFTNDKDDKKKSKNASTDAIPSTAPKGNGTVADDKPKGPTNKQIVGGASWTGKLPMNMLSELCQKQKWEKPEYTMHKTPDGFTSMVILAQKHPKSGEITRLAPFRIKPEAKQLLEAPTAVEARNLAATWALFRVNSMKNISFMLPPQHASLWKGGFSEIKKEDVKEGRGWMYDADPFAAHRETEKVHAEIAKKREIREQEAAVKAAQPPPLPGLQHQSQDRDLMRGWKNAQKVEMGKMTRRRVEAIVRQYGIWGRDSGGITIQALSAVVSELEGLGFRRSHVQEAAEVCTDKEEIIEWLLIHVPEDDLPTWALPEGYVAGVSLASGNLKREGAVKRLASGGFATALCEAGYDACDGDERRAAQRLQDALMQEEEEYVSKTSTTAASSDNEIEIWNEEQLTLDSIYAEKYEKLGPESCNIHLEVVGLKQKVTLQVTRPCDGTYPEVPPILTIKSQLPAYIRLSVTRQALLHACAELLGEQMIFNLVDWLENEVARITENPGRLADVFTVSSVSGMYESQGRTDRTSKKRKRHPLPISWHPGTVASMKMLSDRNSRQSNPAHQKMMSVRQSLPAWQLREAIVDAVERHQVVIVSGETGSGKSTQSVQFILDAMIENQLGEAANIICTQPRRISALGLADRVANERCGQVGQEVGYAIRGESKHSAGVTKITFCTTGVLLRRLQTSGDSAEDVVRSLADVSHVFIDEVHERSLDTDFLLALLRDVVARRKDLKVILMSATLDADVFERYFGGPGRVGRVEIQGRTHPVEDLYLDDVMRLTGAGKQQTGYDDEDVDDTKEIAASLRGLGMGINYELIANLVAQIDHELGSERGGILIFLPGTVEINRTIDAMRSLHNIYALPLHASLLSAEQKRVFLPAPHGQRKVIASTNVAETSITIEDIVAVIDTGRVKETRYDPQSNIVKLEDCWASRAACKQRRGRAGRVRAGKCYKLFTRRLEEATMQERPEPEIRRTPLEQLCLSVVGMGLKDVPRFLANTLTPPETLAVEGAMAMLHRVGALEADELTALGRHMAMIPADLKLSKLMVYGTLFDLFEPCITMAAILTVKSPFVSPQTKREESKAARLSFSQNQGDVIADLLAYDTWSARRSRSSYRELRSWCDDNYLSSQTLNDISTTRAQYISSLKEIGFLPISYHSSQSDTTANYSFALLQSLLLSALHPQTLRIALPTQKYAATSTGTLALDPASREIKFFSGENDRVFIHPSSTLFSAQTFANNATFLSYWNRVQTSKVFARDVTPATPFAMLLFGGPVEVVPGMGLLVDGRWRIRGWARIGVLVGRLRRILDRVLAEWIERPRAVGEGVGEMERGVKEVVGWLVEMGGQDR